MIKILEYSKVAKDEIFARVTPEFDVANIVSDIIENVRKNGDKALLEYTEKFDGARLSSFIEGQEKPAFSNIE